MLSSIRCFLGVDLTAGKAQMRGVRGFTLIELLVVCGIIAILLAILLPTIAGARRQSRAVTCRAQLKDLGNLFNLYLIDSKGRIPRVNPLPSFTPPINSFPYIVEV